jgi:polysaccharide biosynthesis/export protein
MFKNYMPYMIKTILLFIIIFATSCVPYKNLKYFNDIDDLEEPVVNPRTQKIIMPFDKLYIKVLSIDQPTNQLFNAAYESNTQTGNSTIGYLVDEAGEISFPFIGKLKVGGLKIPQASLKLEEALGEYVSKVSVIVKFFDAKVTVLGEVRNQGVYQFSQDKLNIYEALALGGGLTQYGNRRNVVLIRQEGDRIMHYKINLSDSKIDGKDFYYIQNNDVIVVEPLRIVSNNYGNNTYSIILSSITSLMALLIFAGVKF